MLNLSPENSAVVVVDWQVRLAAVMEPETHSYNLSQACILVEAALAAGVPTLVTEQYPKGLGPTVPELLERLPSAAPIEKRDFSCCDVPEFLEALKRTGRSHVVLAGMEAHICVFQTARALLAEGYVVHVPRDAVISRRSADFKAALGLYAQLGAVTTSVETIAFDWVRRAEGPLFKAVSRLVR
jgi:nicotinamidase-related amidase